MAFDDFISSIGSLFGGGGGADTSNPPFAPTQTPPTVPQPGGGGGNILTSLLLGVGAPLISRLMGGGETKMIDQSMKNLSGIGKTVMPAGKRLIGRASKGELTDPQQAMVERMKAEQNARNAQYLSNLGIPVSSAMVQGQNLVDENATRLANDLINQSFDQGIKALSLGGTASAQTLQNAMASRADMAKTINDLAKQIGMVMNAPSPGQPAGSGTVTSQASSAAQGFGAGEYDPYAGMFSSDVGT
jgi:hypothetical protein